MKTKSLRSPILLAAAGLLAASLSNVSFITGSETDAALMISRTARLMGTANGYQMGFDILTDDKHPLFHGKSVAVIRGERGKPGTVTLRVAATGRNIRAQTRIETTNHLSAGPGPLWRRAGGHTDSLGVPNLSVDVPDAGFPLEPACANWQV